MLERATDLLGAATDGEGSLTAESLAKALQEARERVASMEGRQADLQKALAAAREEEHLLERLLAIRQGVHVERSAPNVLEALPSRDTAVRGAKHPAVEEVVAILEQEGRPLHISELMRLLEEHRVRLPGAGKQANVIAHLRRDERVVRPARGMYGLAAWGLEEMPAPAKRARQRRHRRSGGSGKSRKKA